MPCTCSTRARARPPRPAPTMAMVMVTPRFTVLMRYTVSTLTLYRRGYVGLGAAGAAGATGAGPAEPGADRPHGDPARRCGRPRRGVAAQGRRGAGRRTDAAVRLHRHQGGVARPDGRRGLRGDPAGRRQLAGGAA